MLWEDPTDYQFPSISAPEAIIYMIPEPNTRNKRMFFLSPKPHKFPSPTKAAFCIIYIGLSWKS